MPALAAAVLALAGCGSATPTAATTPSPTPTNPNPAACRDFEAASNQVAKLTNGGAAGMPLPQWKQAKADAVKAMDKAGLSATGPVQQRVDDVMALMPADPTELAQISGKADGLKYNAALVRVGTACGAEDATISLTPLTLAPDWLTQ